MITTLPAAVEGSRKRAMTITWTDTANVAVDLTAATITGKIKSLQLGTTRSIDGALALVTASSGIFSWTFGAVDVGEVGKFKVQFIATYAGPSTNRNFIADWSVEDALDI